MSIIIDFSSAAAPDVQLTQTEFHTVIDARKKHAAEPLKNSEDVRRVIQYLVKNGRYRDNLLFVMGTNFGLRCGDLLRFQIGHLVDEHGRLKSKIILQEEKTDKYREVYMNNAVRKAFQLYAAGKEFDIDDYLFPSLSTNNTDKLYETIGRREREPTQENPATHYCIRRGKDGPIARQNVDRMLKKVINDDLGIDVHAGTHLMRKTFAYHTIMEAPDRARALEFLQQILGHSSQSVTLHYAGITGEEMRRHYENLNLGLDGMDFSLSSGLRYAV